MADHVGHPLAQHGGQRGPHPAAGGGHGPFEDDADVHGQQRVLGEVELLVEVQLLGRGQRDAADVGQRAAGEVQHLAELHAGELRLRRQQPGGQLALQRDRRQAQPQQVVHVPGQSRALLLRGHPGQLRLGGEDPLGDPGQLGQHEDDQRHDEQLGDDKGEPRRGRRGRRRQLVQHHRDHHEDPDRHRDPQAQHQQARHQQPGDPEPEPTAHQHRRGHERGLCREREDPEPRRDPAREPGGQPHLLHEQRHDGQDEQHPHRDGPVRGELLVDHQHREPDEGEPHRSPGQAQGGGRRAATDPGHGKNRCHSLAPDRL